jgi:hypothetical protein
MSDIDKLNMAIMNLPDNGGSYEGRERTVYKLGHRDARHAAVEILLEHFKSDAEPSVTADSLEAAPEADERALDLYDEIECDLAYLFGRASNEGHEAGQKLAQQVKTKMQRARAALASPAVPEGYKLVPLDMSAMGLTKLWQQAQDAATPTMPAQFQFAKLLVEQQGASHAANAGEDTEREKIIFEAAEEAAHLASRYGNVPNFYKLAELIKSHLHAKFGIDAAIATSAKEKK